MTDAEFAAWLADSSAPRLTLIEAVANISGTDTTLYLATGAYTTLPTDTPANIAYLPVASNGIKYTERISLSSEASLSVGDIEIDNADGELDEWLTYVWTNRQVQAFIGDPRWPRADFRLVFTGIVADIDTKSRETLNLKIRDKLQRLNTPISEAKLGGSTPNKDMLIPQAFGEVHNISPLLTDPTTLEYQVHDGAVEDIFEVRDNGKPVGITKHNSTGKFTLNASPAGAITASVQGDKPSTYSNTIAKLIQRIVTGFGKVSDRFDTSDLDLTNLAAFDSAHPQPVGNFLSNRENVLNVCQALASSVGAQMLVSRTGLLRLLQINLPPVSTPVAIGPDQMLQRSLRPVERTTVVAAVKIGYCKNYTLQPGLQTTIPAQHKDLFSTEMLSRTATDSTVQALYKLNTEPVQEDTCLLVGTDAQDEADRRLDLFKEPRTVYQFDGTPDLLTLELGQAVTLTHPRFDLAAGKDGIVVMLAPDWMNGRITVGVLI
jgi:hypothetical protein